MASAKQVTGKSSLDKVVLQTVGVRQPPSVPLALPIRLFDQWHALSAAAAAIALVCVTSPPVRPGQSQFIALLGLVHKWPMRCGGDAFVCAFHVQHTCTIPIHFELARVLRSGTYLRNITQRCRPTTEQLQGTTAEVYLHGAHITSFIPAGQQVRFKGSAR